MSELILSLSTATNTTSVALHQQGQLLLSLECYKPRATSEQLPQTVAQLFEKTNQTPSALSAIAITAGPGSYTGLRIGTTFAKGLCYSQNLPLIPINTLEVLCHSTQQRFPLPPHTAQYALLDARRSHVYALLVDHQGQIIHDTHVCHITQLHFKTTAHYNQVYLVGSGVIYAHDLNLGHRYVLIEGDYPKASAMGPLAYQKWLAKETVPLNDYEPLYLSALGAYEPKKNPSGAMPCSSSSGRAPL